MMKYNVYNSDDKIMLLITVVIVVVITIIYETFKHYSHSFLPLTANNSKLTLIDNTFNIHFDVKKINVIAIILTKEKVK